MTAFIIGVNVVNGGEVLQPSPLAVTFFFPLFGVVARELVFSLLYICPVCWI